MTLFDIFLVALAFWLLVIFGPAALSLVLLLFFGCLAFLILVVEWFEDAFYDAIEHISGWISRIRS